ncbi:MAG: polysaccharide pyruvyl transferase family protein [Caldilineaceae bacterium]
MKIGIFGNFGWGNLGNSATLEATVAGVRSHWPAADFLCICTNPDELHRQYGFDVAPVRWGSGEGLNLPESRMLRIPAKLVQRPPSEVRLWQRARQLVEGLDLLLVAGTGVLDDFAIGPMDIPYDLFKWSVQARRSHVPLAYLSTGAGPIDHRRSRFLITQALSRAFYRSYRDEYSRSYLESVGFDISHDSIYPDLAFGLPIAGHLLTKRGTGAGEGSLVVGLGVMSYSGSQTGPQEGEAIYQEYLQKVVAFGAWLLSAGHTVRLVLGDTLVDQRAFEDVRSALAASAPGASGRVIAEPVHSVEELLCQLAQTDVVVATRFHNVLLSLLVEKPVISVSYNQKNDDLMADMGLEAYCQPIRELNVRRLQEQFQQLVANAGAVRQQIAAQTTRQRQLLDEQYERVRTLSGAGSKPRGR